MKIIDIKSLAEKAGSADYWLGDSIGELEVWKIASQLLRMVEVAKGVLVDIKKDEDADRDENSCKCHDCIRVGAALAEMKRLEDDPLKQLVQEAQEMGLYDPPKGDEND